MSKNINACLSSKSDDWRTPTDLYDFFVKQWGFEDLFPYCSNQDQYGKYYKSSKLFINPPFSKMKSVVRYVNDLAHKENNNIICLLVPVRTDTKWFDELFKVVDNIIFIKGGLHFNDSKSTAFPTMLMIFGLYDLEVGPFHYFVEDLEDMKRLLNCAFYINRLDERSNYIYINKDYMSGLVKY